LVKEEDILEPPKPKQVTDLHNYLVGLKLEMNIQSYTYIKEVVSGTTFVAGIRLMISVLGVLKPVDIKFSELGFKQTRITEHEADKIFEDD
jgi:hypothetical protein